ncbi:MAG: DUF512 domain-containing protein [Lachnospiraceae bacterium]|nr:DUF512 domain-containing protein [Lachnospiraceae bacterium]
MKRRDAGQNGHVICRVEPGSIADELELEPGDILLSVNGQKIGDIFDYQYLTNEEYLEILIRKKTNEEWELEIEKEFEEDLGLEFENGLMDEYRSCRNKCIFCFIDQMPKGMRETLYFKDDDSRLSFLQGNYVTLTNMSDEDIDRIIRYRLSPINISFQTTNPKLRCTMLNNRFAGDALAKADRLYEAGIEMNGQIVLCKGVNDEEELERSIRDLSRYLPHLQSVSVVPVGLTKYREGLYPLEPFSKEDARKVIALVHRWQEKLHTEYGLHFIHCGDEWYILAGEEMPSEETYDGYLQLENGVGMTRLLLNETKEALEACSGDDRIRRLDLATGQLAGPFLEQIVTEIQKKYPGIQVCIHEIRNDFFGPRITVAGLITGQDLIAQLSGELTSEELLLPDVMLRDGEEVFLDDVTLSELSGALQVKITVVKSGGQDLVDAILGNL